MDTIVYRKSKFSGLEISYLSNCPLLYKFNSFRTLIHRAYQLCSSNSALSFELDFLPRFFCDNGFPDHVFHNICKKYLDKIYQPASIFFTAHKKIALLQQALLQQGRKALL